jgi:hypothetical protein
MKLLNFLSVPTPTKDQKIISELFVNISVISNGLYIKKNLSTKEICKGVKSYSLMNF